VGTPEKEKKLTKAGMYMKTKQGATKCPRKDGHFCISFGHFFITFGHFRQAEAQNAGKSTRKTGIDAC
jgi:hypothetical protein